VPVDLVVVVNNAIFFGAALALLLLTSFVVSRLTGRILGLARRGADEGMLRAVLVRRARRLLAMATVVLALGLVTAAAVFSVQGVDVAARGWAWVRGAGLLDPAVLGWRLGELVVLGAAALVVHRVLRALVELAIGRLQGDPAFLLHHDGLARLLARAGALLRWGVALAAATAAAGLLAAPPPLAGALRAATIVALAWLGARVLVAVGDVGVDIGVQLARALEGRRAALRYVGRLEHLAKITKRTLEYFCVVGAATLAVDQLRPDTWLSQTGVVLIRLIALVYVGRVVIEVFGLLLREVLLAAPDRRTGAEQQQRLTLVPVVNSVMRYAVFFCMVVMGLQELGVDTSPILAGAGLLGLAVGLGAQAFVGDVVSGFFILFEGLFLVGDRVRVGEVVGNVEEIGVRVLKVRDEFGVLHCIPNGEVRLVANHAREYVNAVVEFSLPYDEDIPRILDHLRATLSQKRSMHPDILSDTAFSIQDLMDTGALIRSLTRVRPGCDDSVGDVVRVELFAALTTLGVTPSACYVIKTPADAGAARRGG
jgi:small conductance mechanosensitive channel